MTAEMLNNLFQNPRKLLGYSVFSLFSWERRGSRNITGGHSVPTGARDPVIILKPIPSTLR